MIKIIDENFSLFDEFEEFCKIDSFGTRIYSHFLCYGYGLNFVDFWVQVTCGTITSAFCKLEGEMVVCISKNADFDEILSFLNFQEKMSVTMDSLYADKFSCLSDNRFYGDVLEYKNNVEIPDVYALSSPEIRDYHNLLLLCKSEDFFVADYPYFLSDVVRRSNRGMCKIFGIYQEDVLVSCAMNVSQTDSSVILGAVATHPEYRKHGYAGFIVKKLAQHFCDKKVYIYTTIEKNTKFYEKLGFSVAGRWVKYTFGG